MSENNDLKAEGHWEGHIQKINTKGKMLSLMANFSY